MATLWRKLRALPAADRGLLAETALLMLGVRAGVRFLSFDTLRQRLERSHAARRGPRQTPERVAWAIGAVSRRLPGTTCLVQSLTAHALLRRHGYRPELHIGVRAPGGGAAVPLDAHAWVECEGRVVVGDVDGLEAYGRLQPVRPTAPDRS